MIDTVYTLEQLDNGIITLNCNGHYNRLILPSEAKVLVENLIEYINLYSDDDIINFNSIEYKKFVDDMNKPSAKIIKDKQQKRFVYLFKNNFNKYKIGLSSNPQNRLQAFNNPGNPVEIICISKPIYNAFKHEQYLHSKYSSFSIGNEWYDFKDDITVINNIKQEILNLE